MDKRVGITTTIPVEIIYAAGLKPVDLNNIFITSSTPGEYVQQAEITGFARSTCAWIKGIYSVVLHQGPKRIVAVTGGDCSNTIAMGEVLETRGVEVIPFEYPKDRSHESLLKAVENLMARFKVSWEEVNRTKERLDRIREKLRELDRYTYESNVISGLENHLFLVSSSDFWGDPEAFEAKIDELLAETNKRPSLADGIRLGFLGVPPIFTDFYEVIEQKGARVVFNEVQRQFSMPLFDTEDLIGQYLSYTYPYEVRARIDDIRKEVDKRNIHGLIHYTQTFCHRQIYDIILREELGLPILTLEGDRPGKVDTRTALRIETFIEMLRGV